MKVQPQGFYKHRIFCEGFYCSHLGCDGEFLHRDHSRGAFLAYVGVLVF